MPFLVSSGGVASRWRHAASSRGIMMGSRPVSGFSSRTWLFLVLAIMACLLILVAILWTRSDPSDLTQVADAPADPPSAVVDAPAAERCAATALVDVSVSMQPDERGSNGTRTFGTVTISTASTEPLRVWILVDEGESGDNGWSRQAWESAGSLLTSGGPIEQRVSQTVYDDGGSTWRTINGFAAWRATAECIDLPTDAELDAIASPL